jgi:hypothetical protein
MLIMTMLAGLIATMFSASVAASLIELRHEDVKRDDENMRYNRGIF